MGNSLKYKSKFKKLLQEYTPNEKLLTLLSEIKLVLLVAPAATGRNTIIHELIKSGNYHYLISDTTRKKRVNDGLLESNGVEYWFRDEDSVMDDLEKGNYLGPAIIHDQQISGINISELQKSKNDFKIAITDIEIQGAKEIYFYKKDSLNIFVLPPSFDEWMRRLDSRGSMDLEEKKRRLKSAAKEIEEAILDSSYVFFINDDLNKTIEEINNFIVGGEKTNTVILRKHASSILSALYAHPFWHS